MDYVRDLRELVGHMPLILTGSVVLILNEKISCCNIDQMVVVPGGLMELGESLEDTARREMEEGTGLI